MNFEHFKEWWKVEKQGRADKSIKKLIKDIIQEDVTVQGYKIHFSTGHKPELRAKKDGVDTIRLKYFGDPDTQEQFEETFRQELEKNVNVVGGKLKSRRNRKNKKSGKSKSTKNRRKSKRRH